MDTAQNEGRGVSSLDYDLSTMIALGFLAYVEGDDAKGFVGVDGH